MAEASLAPESATAVTKAAIIKVRSAAATKLSYMRTLATKLSAASRKGILNTVKFLRRSWGYIPVAVSSSFIGGLSATKQGYLSLVGGIAAIFRGMFRLSEETRRSAWSVFDTIFYTTAKMVKKFNPDKGQKLAIRCCNFTDKRERFFQKLNQRLITVGNIVKRAYEHKITYTTVNIWSSVISIAMLVNAFTKGFVKSLVADLPAIGAFLASVISGGWATVIAVVLVATIAAITTLALKNESIVLLDSVVETDDEPVATSEIKDVNNGEVTVNVVGDVTPEVAQAIAEKHVEVELANAQAAVKRAARPNNRPSQHKSKKKK